MTRDYQITQIKRDDANEALRLYTFFDEQRNSLPHSHWMMDRTMGDFHALTFGRDDARIWVAETGSDLGFPHIRGMIILRHGSVIASTLDADDSYAQKTDNTLKTAFQAAAKKDTIGLIECLLVSSEYSRNGMAQSLIAAAVQSAQNDPRITFLAANIVQDNTGSISTFEKAGFSLFGQNTRDDDQKTARYVAGLDLSTLSP